MAKAFASQSDLTEKKITFEELAPNCYAYTTEGDPNAGVVIGDDCVMVIEALATPVQAQRLIDKIREITDKPIKHLVLSHYHAVRVMGASAYNAQNIIASDKTYNLIVERGEADFKSEVERFPRLFEAVETVPGLTWPTMVFKDELTIHMGKMKVQILALGGGHTAGDTVIWVPEHRVLYSGDEIEWGQTPYCGDAILTDWPHTLDAIAALQPEAVVPGRGEARRSAAESQASIESTKGFVTELFSLAKRAVDKNMELKEAYDYIWSVMEPKYGNWGIFQHCMPFNVSRAYDEARGIHHPRVWTAERDKEMWDALA